MKARSQRKHGRERGLGRERVGGRGGLLASRVGPRSHRSDSGAFSGVERGALDSAEGRATCNSSRRTSQRPDAWIVDRAS